MKTKDEIIKEAWGEHYETFKDFITENGWVDFKKAYGDIGLLLSFRDTSLEIMHNYDPKYCYYKRPASLSGIDNNNNWNSMEDFDGNDEDYFLFLRYVEGEGEPPIFTSTSSDDFEIGYFTHYRKIDITKPPLY